MLSWFAEVAGAFALSTVSAYGFLLLRCRGVGPPFGPRARWWAVTIIVITAIISTGLGLALAAVSHLIEAVYISLVVPSILLLSKLPARLYDRMGDDMQDWCDTRLKAVEANPQWIADA